jgi:hypothetical protein
MKSVHFDFALVSDLVSAVKREDFQGSNINEMSGYLASVNNSNIKQLSHKLGVNIERILAQSYKPSTCREGRFSRFTFFLTLSLAIRITQIL